MKRKQNQLTIKEARLVTARAAGHTLVESYNLAGYKPRANKHSVEVDAHQTLSKPLVKEALQIALKAHDITLNNALAPISKALKAITPDGTEDINLQLKGSDRALRLLGVNTDSPQLHLHQHLIQQREKYSL